MANDHDAIVIGAGIDGLVAAALLARAGRDVVVVERRDEVGGVASSVSIAEGFRGPVGPDLCLVPEVLSSALALPSHGLKLHAPDPVVFAPAGDGQALTLWRDPVRTREEIGQFSKKDAEAWPRFAERVRLLSGVVESLAHEAPPVPDVEGVGDLVGLLKKGWDLRRRGTEAVHEVLRTLPLSIADFLNEWFESEPLKACLAGTGVRGVSFGTRAAGTAWHFLSHQTGSQDPWLSERLPVGGAGALGAALASAARAFGARLETGSPVRQVAIDKGRARGVLLADGRQITAPLVVSSESPRRTLLEWVDPEWLAPSFTGEVQAVRYRGVQARMLLALSALPDLRGRPGVEATPHHGAVLHVGESLDDLEQASDAAKYGEISSRPFLVATLPSLLDPTLAPAGAHVMSVTMQYAPYRLREGSWGERRAALGDVILQRLGEVAANIPESVIAHRVITPLDYETEYGMPEGSLLHGEMALDQMLFMRPVPGWSRYRTPVQGLYLCGPGTHPGAAATGAAGWNAGRTVLADRS